jgi:hypothetical protein
MSKLKIEHGIQQSQLDTTKWPCPKLLSWSVAVALVALVVLRAFGDVATRACVNPARDSVRDRFPCCLGSSPGSGLAAQSVCLPYSTMFSDSSRLSISS